MSQHRVQTATSRTEEDEQPHSHSPSETTSGDLTSEIEIDLGMSREDLYRNARKAQSRAIAAVAKVKASRRKADELATTATDADSSPRKRPKFTSSEVQETIKTVEYYGRKFLVTHMLWLHGDTKASFETPIDDNYHEFERFENTETMLQGQLREIQEVVPEKYLGDLSSDWFRRAFQAGMQSQRSNISTRVRTRCGAMIFGCTEAQIKSAAYRKETFGSLIGWKKNDKGEWYYDAWDSEILHGSWQGKHDIHTVFLNKSLMMVISGVIRGPASVVSMSAGEGSVASRNSETLDVKWGLDHTTPGMIAAGAVLVRWAASVDTLLTVQGSQSGIRWKEDFEGYLQYLFNGLRLRKASVLNVFRQWDKVLFPSSSSGFGGRQARSDRCAKMKSVMDALEGDDEVEEDRQDDNHEDGQRHCEGDGGHREE
ncbi:hypothetical protein DEU56DRAFT_757041 [Suillus clintonianus]|uniref:uncharacterized protein n=1 Tax=Suillus clintonianus TaxID=1904413 RepID=UPI001B87B711|nr:uncharacterized protein DEU56DRAFT_757041 [Suillus clintonianus]KAG2133691.1 hypothetical protein DEU56DRAFT_757041 [Suillus clintonianus]